MGVEPTTSALQTPTIQIAEFHLRDELLSKTITVPVLRLSVLLCICKMLASIMVELKYGSLSIFGHSLSKIIPLWVTMEKVRWELSKQLSKLALQSHRKAERAGQHRFPKNGPPSHT